MFINNFDAEERILKFLTEAGLSQTELSDLTEDNYIMFGGAVRSAIAGEESCNDIDILVYDDPKSFPAFTTVKKYDRSEYAKDTSGRQIQLPGKKKIDLLTPYCRIKPVFRDFVNFLAGVDINVCGIGYNRQFGFIESLPDQIKMCRRKCFKVNCNADGYDERKTPQRVEKLIELDWLQI